MAKFAISGFLLCVAQQGAFIGDRQPDRNGVIVPIWMGIRQARRARQGRLGKGLKWDSH